MDNLIVEKSFKSPLLKMDFKNGNFLIEGELILENPRAFFEPVFLKLDDYIHNPLNNTTLVIRLDFFNTTSSVWLFKLLKKLIKLRTQHKDVTINWFYNDDDMLDLIDDYESLLDIPISRHKTSQTFSINK